MSNHIGRIGSAPLNSLDHLTPEWITPFVFNRKGSGFESSVGKRSIHTSTQPIIEEAKVFHVGKKSTSFSDDFYNRIVIEPSYINVGNLVSDQFYEVTVFNGYFVDKPLIDLSVQNADGLFINGPLVGDIWGPLETKTFQITISADGPPNVDAKIQFDWDGIDDDIDVVIVGARIVMLPYQAEAPWLEALEWKTNVLTTNNGTEQRIRLRKAPRQYFSASFPIKSEQLARSYNMAYGWIGKRWAIGVWSETQLLGELTNGATVLYCDTSSYDFRPNSLVCLWESEYRNDIIEIESVAADSLVLKRVLTSDYSNALLLPVRMGMVSNGSIGRQTNGFRSALSIEYVVTDNEVIASDVPLQYLGDDIYYDESLMGDADGLQDSLKVRLDEVDYETGVVDYYTPWKYTKKSRAVEFLNDGPAECWTFKKWLNRRAGRLRPYWLPTFENNLRLNQQGLIGSALLCENDDYRTIGKDHNHIAIHLHDGTWLARGITGTAIDGGLTSIAIDEPIYIYADQIERISFLTLHRLDADKIEIEWIGNYINQCSLRILEIKP